VILAPLKNFLVDLKINNPSDTATHYVRAVIKNAVTGATITSLDLTDNGSGYFSKVWQTPADPTGTGLQITIHKTVYDNSGYSIESVIYGTTVDSYIVRDLPGSSVGFGGALLGGFGSDRQKNKQGDEKTVALLRKLLDEEKKEKEGKEITPEVVQKNHDEILELLKSLESREQKTLQSAEKEIVQSAQIIKALADKVGQQQEGLKSSLANMNNLAGNIAQSISELAKISQNITTLTDGKTVQSYVTKAIDEALFQLRDNLNQLKTKWYDDVRDMVETSLSQPVTLYVSPTLQAERGEPKDEPEEDEETEDPAPSKKPAERQVNVQRRQTLENLLNS
jgi:hypothetical protein